MSSIEKAMQRQSTDKPDQDTQLHNKTHVSPRIDEQISISMNNKKTTYPTKSTLLHSCGCKLLITGIRLQIAF